LAIGFLSSGQYGLARTALERALSRDPDNVELRAQHQYAAAREALEAKQPERALQLLEAALALNPQLGEAVEVLRSIKEQQRTVRRGFFQKMFGDQ
jgi:tetratricopeptide (TPR) repeat protein